MIQLFSAEIVIIIANFLVLTFDNNNNNIFNVSASINQSNPPIPGIPLMIYYPWQKVKIYSGNIVLQVT